MIRFASDFLDVARVRKYAAAMRAGAVFPAVRMQVYPDSIWEVADGHHRVAAARLVGWSFIAYICLRPEGVPYRRTGLNGVGSQE